MAKLLCTLLLLAGMLLPAHAAYTSSRTADTSGVGRTTLGVQFADRDALPAAIVTDSGDVAIASAVNLSLNNPQEMVIGMDIQDQIRFNVIFNGTLTDRPDWKTVAFTFFDAYAAATRRPSLIIDLTAEPVVDADPRTLAQQVPEPATLALVAGGLVAAWARRLLC